MENQERYPDLNQCHRCRSYFIGDKRAGLCADCAYGPKWVCNNCGHIDAKEAEVMYWKCGEADDKLSHSRPEED